MTQLSLRNNFAFLILTCALCIGLWGCEPKMNNTSNNKEEKASGLMDGVIAVAFQKNASQDAAEKLLKKFNLKFKQVRFLNLGKVTEMESGLKYLVEVPVGQEANWINKIEKQKIVKTASSYFDPATIRKY